MSSLDFFINFLYEHRNDDRIHIYKKMKYGFRHYYINFTIDDNPNDKNGYSSHDEIDILIDNRNQCIEIIHTRGLDSFVVEDKELVEKWSQKLEEHLNSNLDEKIKKLFENSLNECYDKNLYREYQMNKIFNKSND